MMDPTSDEKKPWYKNLFLWYFIIGAVTLTLIRPLLRREPPPPPVQGHLPAFELADQDGKPFNINDLEDRSWIVNFVATSCTSACAQLTDGMFMLQERYNAYGIDGVQLITITADPENDTPEVLRAYAETHGADPERWNFLTGKPDTIRTLLTEGFDWPPAGPGAPPGASTVLPHPGRFVILDPSGGIRGYYGSDVEGLDEVYHRARHVLREVRER